MREIVLDTETTGLNARLGDRIIEIAAVEMVNRRLTGNHFHCYINPRRKVEEGALRVHGLTGLRVCDASIIPETPVSALNAPSMLIGLRGARRILEDHV